MTSVNDFLDSIAPHVDLGHKKRDLSFLRQIAQYCNCSEPQENFDVQHSIAAMMSSYRFSKNDKFTLDKLREIRLNHLKSRCKAQETILVINDISVLNYTHHDTKEDRRSVGDGHGKGYEYGCNLAVSLQREQVLGVAHDCLIDQDGSDDRETVAYHDDELFESLSPEKLECNHKHLFVCQFRHLHKQMPGTALIAVADREFDDHYLFDQCTELGQHFVIRSNALRNVQLQHQRWLPTSETTSPGHGLKCEDGYVCARMSDIVEHLPLTSYKSLPLDGKGRLTDAQSARTWAQLSFGACLIRLYRPFRRNNVEFRPQRYVDINLVVVKEDDSPSGRDPVCWVILTSLPIESKEDLTRIARIYELRWKIECYFKLLKSGYKIEQLRVNTSDKVARHLVLMSIAAIFVLNLKETVNMQHGAKLDDNTYAAVKHAGRNLNDQQIPLSLRIFTYMASLGGWLGRKNDPISTLTLMRGCTTLMQIFEAVETVGSFISEAKASMMQKNA